MPQRMYLVKLHQHWHLLTCMRLAYHQHTTYTVQGNSPFPQTHITKFPAKIALPPIFRVEFMCLFRLQRILRRVQLQRWRSCGSRASRSWTAQTQSGTKRYVLILWSVWVVHGIAISVTACADHRVCLWISVHDRACVCAHEKGKWNQQSHKYNDVIYIYTCTYVCILYI